MQLHDMTPEQAESMLDVEIRIRPANVRTPG